MGTGSNGGAASGTPPQLHDVEPREVTGRDVIARFQAQFRAAALESLRILQGDQIERVYCDYQDDVVTRATINGLPQYHFIQVKTKDAKKHRWARLELFGIVKRTPSKPHKKLHAPGFAASPATSDQLARIRSSFVGKLLEHTVNFPGSCVAITFLTNAFFDDDVEEVGSAIDCGDFSERTLRFLADNYSEAYGASVEMSEIHGRIRKLKLSAGNDHIDPHHSEFENKAVNAVWKYSEIDLSHTEGVELVEALLALIQKRSSTKLISELTASELDKLASVELDDLLGLLPVSRGAYKTFLKQGDGKALKKASILQRKLSNAGASEQIIEAASRWKVDWDDWYRTYRHSCESDVVFLQQTLNSVYVRWSRGEVSFVGLKDEVGLVMEGLKKGPLAMTLTHEVLIGGILAELVRSESR